MKGTHFMLVPDPKVLRELLTRYAETRLAHAEKPTLETRRALDDVAYTLCVTTSTSRIDAALSVADTLLERTCCARAEARDAEARETERGDAVRGGGVTDAGTVPDDVRDKDQADLAA
ncbi:DUF5133 domain-containing protein [Streptomyces sp. NPDC004111]|uniref:DUF5133 domain-containing protein n=1 Tax=Streptomyces sp. NPDC004111 TaxID=3364690 RepID=UPI0036C56DD4